MSKRERRRKKIKKGSMRRDFKRNLKIWPKTLEGIPTGLRASKANQKLSGTAPRNEIMRIATRQRNSDLKQ